MLRLNKKVISRRADDNNGGGGGILLLIESNTSSRVIFVDDENMVVEILSRLPVKSVLRFKCVSKRWCSLIQEPYFVDLHSARSITRPGATFFISRDYRGRNITFFGSTLYDGPHFHSIDYVSFISDAGGHDRFGPHYYQINNNGYYKLKSTQILNGLLCMSFKEETVWILNPSTRKTILLTKTNIKEEENKEETIKKRDDGDHDEYNWMNKESFVTPWYAFGFDPVTKKYKIICICQVNIRYTPPQLFLYHPHEDHDFLPQLLKTYYLCMVLTIGDDDCCWRRMDEIPPYPIHPGYNDPVYLNGVIYWGNINANRLFMVVGFNLSSEKFSVINFILKPRPLWYPYGIQLYEVDGCLAILVGRNNNNNNNNKNAKRIQIWKLVVQPPPPPDATAAAATACCWVKETILTLPFGWRERGYLFEVIGKNQILLKRYNSKRRNARLWYYDRDNNHHDSMKKKKTREKLEFTGECASFTGILSCSQTNRSFYTCTETLWSR